MLPLIQIGPFSLTQTPKLHWRVALRRRRIPGFELNKKAAKETKAECSFSFRRWQLETASFDELTPATP